ncbi:hypothetical protein KSS87_016223 [Heliosperma pusillum]|nr:hypothetical protein KSS87_016223 [Heliosperma pusillum]
MFTPQKKIFSGWSSTPRSEKLKTPVSNSNLAPRISDGYENGERDSEDFVDLGEKVSNLEKELFEYQYNMGLLLLEKKDWSSKLEDIQQALGEQKDALKREQTAHFIAISDFEKREENLRKALGVEKQCVLDMEKALREMRSEHAEIKFTADSKLAEANALASSIEEKSLEVEAKLRAADAKFAEASRKSSEIDRKLQDLERREGALRRERMSFNSEKDAHEGTMSKQREDLLEWERKLQEGEERLCEGRRILNQREERANEVVKVMKLKEVELEEMQKKMEQTNVDLKKKEEDISQRLHALIIKEKEFDTVTTRIVGKEKELLVREEQLNEREKNEMQKLLDEHKAQLDAKEQEFESEINQRRKSVDEELKSKVVELEKKELEVNHMEEKITKREKALDKKLEKLKEKENDLEIKTKALKEKERALKEERKSVDMDKKQLLIDSEELLKLKDKLEEIKAANEEQMLKIQEEKEKLQLTEEERSEHLRLQSELKREISQCRSQREVLLKEAAELKHERMSFEQEWEALDEKKAEIERESKRLTDEREKWEKSRHLEEERLRCEGLSSQKKLEADREAFKLDKELFEAYMKQEKSLVSEKEQAERSKMSDDFEQQKRDFEIELHTRFEEKEAILSKREQLFEEEKEREQNNINHLREVAERGLSDLKEEERRMAKVLEEVTESKKEMEGRRLSIQKDIDELVVLSGKLKEQREQLLSERERFIAFADRLKSCDHCGEVTRVFVLSDLQYDRREILPLPKLAEDYIRNSSKLKNDVSSPVGVNVEAPTLAKSTSWLRKCTEKILKLSPIKRGELIAIEDTVEDTSLSDLDDNAEPSSIRYDFAEEVQELSSFDFQREQVNDDEDRGLVNNENNKDPEVSHNSGLISQQPSGKRGRGRVIRTHSVKAVMKDAKDILGNSLELGDSERPNGNDVNQELSENVRKGRKRVRPHATAQTTVSAQDDGESETRSDSIAAGGPRIRRRKTTAAEQVPAVKRYNLRRPKTVDTVAAVNTSSDSRRVRNENGKREKPEGNSRLELTDSAGVASDNTASVNLMQAEIREEMNDGSTPLIHRTVETTEISEEVNGTPIRAVENDDEASGSMGGSSGDDDDDEVEHPGEASIGKKLWKFLTT